MTLQRLLVMVAALWWGAISGISLVAVPFMFSKLGPAVAGPVAAELFSLQCWIGFVLGFVLLFIVWRMRDQGEIASISGDSFSTAKAVFSTMGIVVLAMVLILVQELMIAVNIVTARATSGNLHLWHTLGLVTVLGQWLCTGIVLLRAISCHSQK